MNIGRLDVLKGDMTVCNFVALIISALNVYAAYITIPNFYDMAINKRTEHIRWLGMAQYSYNGVNYTSWNYEVVDGKTNEYVNDYINKLADKWNIDLIGQNADGWFFIINDRRAKDLNKIGGSYHIHVGRNGNRVVMDTVGGIYPE